MVLRNPEEKEGWSMRLGSYDLVTNRGTRISVPSLEWNYKNGGVDDLQIQSLPHIGLLSFSSMTSEYHTVLKVVLNELNKRGIEKPPLLEEAYGHISNLESCVKDEKFAEYCVELRAGWELLTNKKVDSEE